MNNLGIYCDEPLTERRMLALLASGDVRLPAVDIQARAIEAQALHADKTEIQFGPVERIDAIVDVSWHSNTHAFVVECKVLSTPKSVDAAVGQALRYSQTMGLAPMVFVPYLSPEALERLEASGVSGVDLSGNCIISVPGAMLVYRTGAPNRYPSRRKGPNPYRGASSLVARTLAVRLEFESSREIEAFIREHRGVITQSTISKALDELEEDLVIRRQGRRAIRVLQYDVLLDNLIRNFERPGPSEMRSYKVSGSQAEIGRVILDRAAELGEQAVVTGIGSASHYTAMAQSPPLPIYCGRLDLLDGYADSGSRFPNVNIRRMTDAGAYYDARFEGGLPWASVVQTYVELMNGGARDREMAEHVRRLLPHGANGAQSIKSEISDNDRTTE